MSKHNKTILASGLLLFSALFASAQIFRPNNLFMVLASAVGCTVGPDDFSTFANWSTNSVRGAFDITTNPGIMTVTGGDGTDGDAYIIYSACTNTYPHMWTEVKMVNWITNTLTWAGDQGGPLFRASQSTIGTIGNGVWNIFITWNPPDGVFYASKMTNDIWCCALTDQNALGGIIPTANLATNHYMGVECIGDITNMIVRVYDNGTSHVDWTTTGWTNLLGEMYGVNGNTAITQKTGFYTGIGYGDGGARSFPASTYDDYRSGSFDSFQIDTSKRVTNNISSVTTTITLNSETTLLGVHIACANGATTRTGGAPDYNGVTLTQRGTTQKASASPEGSSEYWDLISPGTGSSLTLTVPNTGSAPLYITAVAFRTTSGKLPVFDTSVGGNGTSANPSVTVTPTAGHIGDLVIAGSFTGNNAVVTLPQGVNITKNDDGAFGDAMMYNIIGQPRNVTNKWTATSDDWAITGGVYYLQ